MAQPVWILSVDLQAKTATFQTGMADAARSARGAFNDIGSGAEGMGRRMGSGMTEARHSIMLLGEEFGIHIPRAVASFLASLGPVGAAMEAAFPFMAIAVGATLLIEHLVKMREAGEKLTDDQVKFGTAVNSAFNTLDEKLIQAQIKSDELKNDHLGALKLQLELIDKQSLQELVHSFEEVAKAADVVMKDLQGHWYTFGIGSDGANHALQQFKTEYESLAAQGKADEASGLLKGTLDQAIKVRDALKAYRENSGGLLTAPKDGADTGAALRAYQTLHAANLSGTEKELQAQQQLVETLQKQVGIEERVNELKKADSANTTRQTGNEEASRRAAAAREAAESQLRMGEQSIAADRATADALLTVHRASLEERLASDLDFANRDRDVKMAANAAEIAALDRSGKDYTNQLQALNDKAIEIQQEYDTKVATLKATETVAAYNRDLQALQQSIREQIEATQSGTAARLAAIDAGLREEEARNLQDTQFYRDLTNQRIQEVTREAEEEGKRREQAGIEAADSDLKIGELRIAMERAHQQILESTRFQSEARRISEETRLADEEYRIQTEALEKKIAALDKSGKDYLNKLKELQDKEKQLTQQHDNTIAELNEKSSTAWMQSLKSAYQQFTDDMSRSLTQSIMGHQTWARMIQNLGDQVVSGMIQNALKSMMTLDMDKEKQAAEAARWGFVTGMKLPFPANIIAAPVLAAGAFAAVMAFEGGTDRVPGIGSGDVVPTMLTPGEGVVPGGVMDGLRSMVRNGGFEQGPRNNVTMHVHMHASALDADGMDTVLEKHSDKLQRHFENTLRRMNR
ncbi:MAG TPA: hypothetical protein VM554_03525 [Acidisarcina sp.]|nr:hypothetical protein [Acidisarcina sp.]